jgi:ABC-2 type transport system permease protein
VKAATGPLRARSAFRELRAEWTKLRTTPSTPWLLAGAVALTVAIGAGAVGAIDTSQCPPAEVCHDTTKMSLTGVWVGQVAVAVLAVIAVSNEYSHGLIHITLTALPRRLRVLGAKTAVVAVGVLAAGAAGVFGSVLAARYILPGNGFPPLSLGDEPTLRAAAGTVLYLALIGVLATGVAIIVRDAAGSIGAVLALLFVTPIAVGFINDPDWIERLQRYSPGTAGMAIQSTIRLDDLPIGPWAGLGVLALWAAGILLVAAVVFVRRDA